MEEGPSLKLDAVTQGLRSHTGCDMRSGHRGELCAHLELSAGQGGRLALEVAAHHTQRLQGPKASARNVSSDVVAHWHFLVVHYSLQAPNSLVKMLCYFSKRVRLLLVIPTFHCKTSRIVLS